MMWRSFEYLLLDIYAIFIIHDLLYADSVSWLHKVNYFKWWKLYDVISRVEVEVVLEEGMFYVYKLLHFIFRWIRCFKKWLYICVMINDSYLATSLYSLTFATMCCLVSRDSRPDVHGEYMKECKSRCYFTVYLSQVVNFYHFLVIIQVIEHKFSSFFFFFNNLYFSTTTRK